MDPTSDPPPPAAVPFTVEPNNHVPTADANSTPSHPPYDEVTSAVNLKLFICFGEFDRH